MKFPSFFFLSILILLDASGQGVRENSLKNTDSLLTQARRLMIVNLDSARHLTLKVLDLASNTGDSSALAKAYHNLGIADEYAGDYAAALSHFLLSLETYRTIKDTTGMGYAANSLGITYFHLNDYPRAAHFYKEALVYFERSGFRNGVASVYNGLGTLYLSMKDDENALQYQIKSLELKRELNDSITLPSSLCNLANMYRDYTEDYPSAESLYLEAEQISEKTENNRLLASAYAGRSELYAIQNKLLPALDLRLKALSLDMELDYPDRICDDYLALSTLYEKLGNRKEAARFLHKSIDIGEKHDLWLHLHDAYKLLAQLYEGEARFDLAFDYLKKYADVADSIYSAESKRIVDNLRIGYETERKEQEISLLNQENSLKELEIQAASRVRSLLLLLAATLMVLLFLIISRYRYQQRISLLLEQKNKELSIANATKDKLFAIISHDLKNPVMAFRSVTETLYSSFDQLPLDEIHRLTEKMRHSAGNLYVFLLNLLNWAKTQQEFIKVDRREVSLEEMVTEVVMLFQPDLDRKQVQLKLSCNLTVRTDKELLHTILRNLIGNAVKFVPEGNGVIEVTAVGDNTGAVISVKDNGPGLSQEEIGTLFEVQHSVSKNIKQKGAGIGLILCRELVEKINGTISVVSKMGQGTVFTVKLIGN